MYVSQYSILGQIGCTKKGNKSYQPQRKRIKSKINRNKNQWTFIVLPSSSPQRLIINLERVEQIVTGLLGSLKKTDSIPTQKSIPKFWKKMCPYDQGTLSITDEKLWSRWKKYQKTEVGKLDSFFKERRNKSSVVMT